MVELEEYLARSGDRETVDAFRPRVLRLFDYFKKFQNEDGLLEKLESWVFVEWSAANSFVQDVNYPSNMLYAKALDAAGKMYGLSEIDGRSRAYPRDDSPPIIRWWASSSTMPWRNGTPDHQQSNEVCQYFAFFFDVATPETHAKLWQTLITISARSASRPSVSRDISRERFYR